MTTNQAILWLTLAVFNIATIRLLMVSLSRVELKEALSEKDPTKARSFRYISQSQDLSDSEKTKGEVVSVDMTSYSRVAGMIGATVLAAFLWGLGNVVLYKAMSTPADIASIMGGVGTFFLAGASLFAPYAFNQLSSVFGRP